VLKENEVTQIIYRQMARNASTQLTFKWLKSDADTIMGLIPEIFRSAIVPDFGSFFCSNQQAAEWQEFLEEHKGMLPGCERSLTQGVETNTLCAAMRQQTAKGLLESFALAEC
jgi:hypothetical protein|tara:strand:+ start:173 stop:511 length:339 start_codon:yes stop_codon:yes gene_type:complete